MTTRPRRFASRGLDSEFARGLQALGIAATLPDAVRTFAQRPSMLHSPFGSAAASARATIAGMPVADRLLLVAGGLAVIGSFAIRIWTIGQPLIEAHSFRQTQTAYTALIYHREGINLLQTPLPVFGPPWVVPFEFPLFQGIAALVMDLGLSTEVALRSTSLFFFVVSAALLWGSSVSKSTPGTYCSPSLRSCSLRWACCGAERRWSRRSQSPPRSVASLKRSAGIGAVRGAILSSRWRWGRWPPC